MHAALEAALGELVLGPALDLEDEQAVHAFFERHGVSPVDRAALREKELERLLIYRQLVRGTLKTALNAAIPRTIARLGTSFDSYLERFLAEHGPATHYLRDVTGEFLAFCAEPWQSDPGVPEYLADLARHEALHIQIAAATHEPVSALDSELELDRSLRFINAARLMRYAFAVHLLSESIDDRSEPERRATSLLAYRDRDHEVRYLELSAFAAALLEHLLDGSTLRRAVEATARAHGAALEPALLEATARLLADLAERGVLLGVDSASNPTEPGAPSRQP
jgi:hypothetical protein